MRIRQALFVLALFVGIVPSVFGQAAFGFTNLDGFPDVISQGVQYNLSGWIVNQGQVALTGNIRIKMSVDNGNPISVDNSFNIGGSLAPGDSTFWTKNNYTFSPGHFRLGHNDVLIWPTMPSQGGAEIDYLEKPMIFTEVSAFKLLGEGFPAFENGVDVEREYSFDAVAENLSSNKNDHTLALYLKISGEDPLIISTNSEEFEQGERATFHVDDLELDEIFDLEDGSLPTSVQFYVLEEMTEDPVNRLYYNVKGAVAVAPSVDASMITVYPNPTDGDLNISMPASWEADASMSIYSMTGKLVHYGEKASLGYSNMNLPAGSYLLVIRSKKGHYQQIVDFR